MSAPAFRPRVVLGPATYVRLPLPLHEKVRAVAHEHGTTYAEALRAIVQAWADSATATATTTATIPPVA